jgi:UDP-glucose 4-epimerase
VSLLRDKCVVVTGASGFIGGSFAGRLAREGAKRIVRIARTLEPGTDTIAVALEALERDVWRRHGIEAVDVLVHLGGFIPKSPGSGMSADANVRSNIVGTQRLLESLPNAPAKIVFASSVDVYARTDERITETSRVDPASLYGASKLFVEKYIELYAAANAIDATILRLGHIYGPGERAYEKLIPNAIRALLSGRAPAVTGDGSTLRDYLYVTDAAEAIVRAAERAGDSLGPINVVSGRSVSVRDIVLELAKLTGFTAPIRFEGAKPGGASLRFDDARLQETLGAVASVPLSDGLRAEIDYFGALAP